MSTTNNTHKIEIVGFGPSDLKSTLKPGWNQIQGPNGAGKSNVLAALLWALGGEVPVKLRHKGKEAYVEIDGVRIKTLSKPMLNIGDLELALRDESPIADVILPNVQDPKRADTKRIEALLRLVDVDVTEEAISILVDDDEAALDYLQEQEPDIARMSIVAAADKVRRRVHEIKRRWEARADESQGKINAVRIETPDVVVEASVVEAQQAYDDAVRIHDRRSGEWSQRQQREAERRQFQETAGERPDVKDAERELTLAGTSLKEIAGVRGEVEQEVARLQERLKGLQDAHLQVRDRRDRAEQAVIDLRKAGEAWDRRKAILDSEITGADEKEVEMALRNVTEARATLEAARTSDEYREACILVEEAQEERELALKRASRYEKLATSVTSRLSLLLAKAGIEKLTVEDGQLMFIHKDGEIEAFTDLSFGERTDAVIDLLARQKVPHDILVLPWQFHAALQPEARDEVGARFAERNICAITEQPADGTGLSVANDDGVEPTPDESGDKPKARSKKANK